MTHSGHSATRAEQPPKFQRPGEHSLPKLGVIEQVAHRSEDRAPTLSDFLTLLGQLDSRLAPLDETDLQLVLELLDLHAEGGLGDGAGLRCLAKMQRLRQCVEIMQLAKSHTIAIRAAYALSST